MAKIPRVLVKIFGSGAGSNQIAVYGSKFAGAPDYTTDAEEAMSLSNWLSGWFSAAIGGNAPAIEDFNAIPFVLSTLIAYLNQAGVPEWNDETVYYEGSFCSVSGAIYRSLEDDNTNHSVLDTAWWTPYGGMLVQQAADYAAVVLDDFIEIDTTGVARTVTLPAPGTSGWKSKKLTITKTSSDANTVTVTDGTFSQILYAQYESVTVFCNGTVWYAI